MNSSYVSLKNKTVPVLFDVARLAIEGLIDKNKESETSQHAIHDGAVVTCVATRTECTVKNHRRMHYTAVFPGLCVVSNIADSALHSPETLNALTLVDNFEATWRLRDVHTGKFSGEVATDSIYVVGAVRTAYKLLKPRTEAEEGLLEEMLDHVMAAGSNPLWSDIPVVGVFDDYQVAVSAYNAIRVVGNAFNSIEPTLKPSGEFRKGYVTAASGIYRTLMSAIGDNRHLYMGGGYPKDAVTEDGTLDVKVGKRRVVAPQGSVDFTCYFGEKEIRTVEGWGEAARWLENGWIDDHEAIWLV